MGFDVVLRCQLCGDIDRVTLSYRKTGRHALSGNVHRAIPDLEVPGLDVDKVVERLIGRLNDKRNSPGGTPEKEGGKESEEKPKGEEESEFESPRNGESDGKVESKTESKTSDPSSASNAKPDSKDSEVTVTRATTPSTACPSPTDPTDSVLSLPSADSISKANSKSEDPSLPPTKKKVINQPTLQEQDIQTALNAQSVEEKTALKGVKALLESRHIGWNNYSETFCWEAKELGYAKARRGCQGLLKVEMA